MINVSGGKVLKQPLDFSVTRQHCWLSQNQFPLNTVSSAEAFFDITAVCEQLWSGSASGNTRINSAAHRPTHCCDGYDSHPGQHHCRTSRQLHVFPEKQMN